MFYVYEKTEKTIIYETDTLDVALGYIENTEMIDMANDLYTPNNYIILTEYKES